ncbi:MAG: hypothetical protein AABX19_03870 [Nanoarchaeota archaeon]
MEFSETVDQRSRILLLSLENDINSRLLHPHSIDGVADESLKVLNHLRASSGVIEGPEAIPISDTVCYTIDRDLSKNLNDSLDFYIVYQARGSRDGKRILVANSYGVKLRDRKITIYDRIFLEQLDSTAVLEYQFTQNSTYPSALGAAYLFHGNREDLISYVMLSLINPKNLQIKTLQENEKLYSIEEGGKGEIKDYQVARRLLRK